MYRRRKVQSRMTEPTESHLKYSGIKQADAQRAVGGAQVRQNMTAVTQQVGLLQQQRLEQATFREDQPWRAKRVKGRQRTVEGFLERR